MHVLCRHFASESKPVKRMLNSEDCEAMGFKRCTDIWRLQIVVPRDQCMGTSNQRRLNDGIVIGIPAQSASRHI